MAIGRRIVLRGVFQGSAVVIALPLLDCFLDGNGEALADTGKRIPARFGTYFWGCGLTKELFVPKTVGPNYDTTQQLASLEAYKSKISVFSGLRAILDDNPNFQHWSGLAAINTGIAPAKSGEFDTQTIDQTIADVIGRDTRFKSIEVTCSGNKNESYSSLGGANLNPPEITPLGLYTRLFGPGFQDPSKGDWKPDPQVLVHQSMLSVVADDRKRLVNNLGASDRARMDQYFTSVREMEQSLDAALKRPDVVAKVDIPSAPPEMSVNKSVPELQKVVPLMARLLALGLATNQTHVFNMALAEPGSTIFMPGDSKPFHQQTHEEPIDPVLGYQPISASFSTHSMKFFAMLVKELEDIKEGDGTLLDHSLVLAYTDTSFAKLHALDGIPIMLAGSANGRVKTGVHIADEGAPVSRVGLTIQQAMGLTIDGWGKGSMATKKPYTEILA